LILKRETTVGVLKKSFEVLDALVAGKQFTLCNPCLLL
jgi:hypothetical protein